MRYPSKSEIAAMDKKLRRAKGTSMTGLYGSPADRFRWELCQNIVRYKVRNNMSQVELAKKLRIDPARISDIVRHRVDKVSTDKLLNYNSRLEPQIEFKIAK